MLTRFRSLRLAAALTPLFLFSFAACSSDDPTGGGPADSTPPSVFSVTAVDAQHIDITFNETLQRTSAENVDNYGIIESMVTLNASLATPGDPHFIYAISLKTDQKTVSLTVPNMAVVSYDMSVAGVKDAAGNAMSSPTVTVFTGTNAADVTPPELVYRSPGPNATGVAVGASLLLTFTEPIPYESFVTGLEWTSGGGPVVFDALSDDNGVHIQAVPQSLLSYGTEYTVTLTGIEDESGNTMTTTSWSFTTTNTVDTTPPTVVSSVPFNNAVNVDVNSNLSITFSEAINQTIVEIGILPNIGDGVVTFSNGGKTLLFDPDFPLADNQQYTLTILPGSVQDLAGNGTVTLVEITFTTASALETGEIRGTLAGDPTSDYANDPTGALVFAVEGSLEGLEEMLFAGSAVVAGNNTYGITNLPDGTYIPFSIMDSNSDGEINPGTGDAVGALGIDFSLGDFTEETVTITGGNTVTGANFPLIDVSAITGTVSYSGAHAGGFHELGIGLFHVAGFDPSNEPDYGRNAYWPDYARFEFLNINDGFPDGSYYLGSYLDANDNGMFDPAVDPWGFHGGSTPTPIVIGNGSDANKIVITLTDPAPSASPSVVWPEPVQPRSSLLHRLAEVARRAASEKTWKADAAR